MERASAAPPDDRPRYTPPHPRGRAAFVIQIRDLEHKDSLTLRLHRLPWRGRFVCADGEISTARIVKAIAAILNTQL